MALRAEKNAVTLGLGDAASIAKNIAKKKKELGREFALSPLKGVRHQNTIGKRIAKREKEEAKLREKLYNPRLKGLQNVPGVTVDADGKVAWQDLKQMVPGIEKMSRKLAPDSIDKAARIRAAKLNSGREDHYER